MADDTLTLVLDTFTDVMGESAPYGASTAPDDVETWTSLTHVHLVYELEKRRGTDLPSELLTGCESLAVLVNALRC